MVNDLSRRRVLRLLALSPLALAARPGRWVTVPAGFTGGLNSGFAPTRVKVR